MKHTTLCLLLLANIIITAFAGDRIEQPLSGPEWRLLFDKEAKWKDDELFLPGTELSKIPTNPPTGGWEKLNDQSGVAVSVPGTVEQFLANGEVLLDDHYARNQNPADGQDWRGVSWWWRTIDIPASAAGRRVLLRFNAARERAEIYLDNQLVGYDLVGSTSFEVDITDKVKPGKASQLAVRITNPGGAWSWGDTTSQMWGKYPMPKSKNFSGITGPVQLVVCDPVYIDDIYVENTPAMREVNVEISLKNQTQATAKRNLIVQVVEKKNPKAELFHEETKGVDVPVGESKRTIKVSAPNAKLWDLQNPNLYTMKVTLQDGSKPGDSEQRPFGFRWFSPEGFGKDALFRLNGKRIVLRSAISWGFWPVSGIVPTPELADRQIRAAKDFGLNMLNFHRCMGQTWVLDKADELGLLYYAEPGGYVSGGKGAFGQALCTEKMKRMAKMFRSHPSMAIYNMINEQWPMYGADKDEAVWARHMADMKALHELDPGRLIGYASAVVPGEGQPDKAKMHMRPFDMEHYMVGWADQHHPIGDEVWTERSYKNPTSHYVRAAYKKEMAIRGEEGSTSSPPRLELIKAEIDKAPNKGWDGLTYTKWYNDFADFLDRKKLKPFFPTVDSLTTAMGSITLESQGRYIECFRISNDNDLYVINGWEAEVCDNHSGVVDTYRYPKADPAILARYNQPLYVAVMSRNLVLKSGDEATVDFFIVNEKDIKGPHTLKTRVLDASGKEVFQKDLPVQVQGGDVYGQLLSEAVKMPVSGKPGMCRIEARLVDAAGKEVTRGQREIVVVDWKSQQLTGNGAVYEWDGTVARFLSGQKNMTVPAFDDTQGKLDWLVVARPPYAEPQVIPAEAFLTKDNMPGVSVTFQTGGKTVAERVDKQLVLDCPLGVAPDPSVPPLANFKLSWEGMIIPPTIGTYTFTSRGSYPKGLQVTIDGKNVFPNVGWWVQSTVTGTAELEAGKPVSIRATSESRNGWGKFELLWSVPGRGGVEPQKILDRVRDQGTTLVIADYVENWMPFIAKATGIKYDGTLVLNGDGWMTGEYFVREHPLFKELPVNCGMDWPYEKLVQAGRCRYFLKIDGEEFVAGGYHTFRPRGFGTAVGVIPYGKGKIVVSSLDIVSNLASKEGPADVARKLLCNYIDYAAKK
jgi:hypothetical protein